MIPTIAVTFYRTKRQMDRVLDLIRRSEPGFMVVIVASSRGEDSILKAIPRNNGLDVMAPAWEILVPESDDDLVRRLLVLGDAMVDSGMVVDLTHARPHEAVAVCKLSAMTDVVMVEGEDRPSVVPSFPRFTPMTGTQTMVLETMRGKRFTRAELVAETGLDGSAAYRALKDLVDMGCLVQENSRTRRTGRPDVIYSVVDESIMMSRMNRRAVGRLVIQDLPASFPEPPASDDGAEPDPFRSLFRMP